MSQQRNQTILQLLNKHTVLTVDELCEELLVSPATVRRCLTDLEQQQLVRKISGGVALNAKAQQVPYHTPFLTQKKAIAEAAVALVKPGDTIFIDAGSTNYEVAQLLASCSDITVVTNCLRISYQLFLKKNVNLFVCGGAFDPNNPQSGTVGEPAEKLISQFRANIAFICSSGIHVKHGVMEHFMLSAKIKATMIEHSSKSVLVCDHRKFGRMQSLFVAPWSKISHLITDQAAPREDIDDLKREGVTVTTVKA